MAIAPRHTRLRPAQVRQKQAIARLFSKDNIMMQNQDLFCLNEKYSTTRLVTKQQPLAFQESNAQVNTTLSLSPILGRKGEGGLRTRGHFKENLENKPLITIITVVFNGYQYLEKTILSIIEQSYDNVEYIVVDGASSDGTVEVIKKYDGFIDYWVSEPDNGIYHAFNKGISLSSGIWMNFMNCGDALFNKSILESIFLNVDHKDISIIYGKHEVIYTSGKRKIKSPGKLENLWKGSIFCHQSSFVLADLQRKHKFDEYYKIGADFKFFYTAFQDGVRFCSLDLVVSSITSGGLSDTERIDSILERWISVERSEKVNLFYFVLILQEIVKAKIKLIFRKFN